MKLPQLTFRQWITNQLHTKPNGACDLMMKLYVMAGDHTKWILVKYTWYYQRRSN